MRRAVTILDIMEDTASRMPDKTAIIEEDRRMSYRELMARARAIGTAICKITKRGGYALNVR